MEKNYGHGAWVMVFALAVAAGAHSTESQAAEAPAAEQDEGGWTVGGGAAYFSSPFRDADDVIAPIPYFLYEGENLSVGLFGVSYRLIDTGNFAILAIAAPRFQITEPRDSPFLTGMKKRGTTLEGGLGAEFNSDFGNLRLEAQADLLDKHKGAQVSLTYSLAFQLGPVGVMPSIGVAWQSADLADYYYGVRPGEATAARPAYTVGDAVVPSIGLDLNYPISKRTSLVALTSVEYLPKTIHRSPIVNDETSAQAIIGVVHRF